MASRVPFLPLGGGAGGGNPMFLHRQSVETKEADTSRARAAAEAEAKARAAPIVLPPETDVYGLLAACAAISPSVGACLSADTEFSASCVPRLNIRKLRPLKRVGDGTFGRVWLALNPGASKDASDGSAVPALVAVKQMGRAELAAAQQVRRACRELRILSRCGHPFAVRAYGRAADDNYIYMVLHAGNAGCVAGLLDQVVAEPGRDSWAVGGGGSPAEAATYGGLPVAWARFLLCCMIDVLSHFHSLGIANRDVKPDNVVLETHARGGRGGVGTEGQGEEAELWPLLVDYGFAKSFVAGGVAPEGERAAATAAAAALPPSVVEQIRRFGGAGGAGGGGVKAPRACCPCACSGTPPDAPPHPHRFHSVTESVVHACRAAVRALGEAPVAATARRGSAGAGGIISARPGPPPSLRAHAFVGTVGYIAPEVILQSGPAASSRSASRDTSSSSSSSGVCEEGYDPFAADVWALGALAYEALVGVPPFGGPDDNPYKVAGRAKRASDPEEGLLFPPSLEADQPDACALIRAMLDPDPTARPKLAQLIDEGESVPGGAWVAGGGGWGWQALRERVVPSPIRVAWPPAAVAEALASGRASGPAVAAAVSAGLGLSPDAVPGLLAALEADPSVPGAFGRLTFEEPEEAEGGEGSGAGPVYPPLGRRASVSSIDKLPADEDGLGVEFRA